MQVEFQPDEINQKSIKSTGRRSGAPTPNLIQNNSQRQTPENENNQEKNITTNQQESSWRRGNSTDLHKKSNSHENSNALNDTRHLSNTTLESYKTNFNKNQSKRYENIQICYVCKMNNKPESEYTSHL